MKVAIVGGGLYGIHIANRLASRDFDVTVFEKEEELMMSASKVNQWRLHKGFHYPRSKETSRTCRDTQKIFREIYSEAIVEDDEHYYCIASEDTKTTPEEFMAHCDEIGLEYRRSDLDIVRDEKVDLTLKVNEDRIDSDKLKEICFRRLEENNVDVRTGHRIDSVDELDDFDYVVVATYANSNWIFDEDSGLRRDYKFELVEKPVVQLSEKFEGKSLVVMDGPFMCFDPYKDGDKFLLGNVIKCIHDTQIGEVPEIPSEYEDLLDNGVVENPEVTNIDEFKSHGSEFIPGLTDAEHVGSMYTFRTTLPDREDTDARPTLVDREGNVFRVFSGKLSACVKAGDIITQEIKELSVTATQSR